MICILTQSFLEVTTEFVMDWLRAWEIAVVRVNGDEIGKHNPMFHMTADNSVGEWKIKNEQMDLQTIKVVWYRRWPSGELHTRASAFASAFGADASRVPAVTSHLRDEHRDLSEFLFTRLEGARWLSRPWNSNLNKLRVLSAAAKLGLDIPATLVTNDARSLRAFARQHGAIVTKAVSNALAWWLSDGTKMSYTARVPPSVLKSESCLASFPSLVQEQLKKRYEIRSFYLDGQFYSMAIFSQSRLKTKTDFRKYDYENQARSVPYRLSFETENRLRQLFDQLELETGSIDMVKTDDGRLVFLEINPVGQFGMVSNPCNYFLERAVARALVRRLNGESRQE
jgi:ATP-GRASP peptide maturase of grasp-with-spasm system